MPISKLFQFIAAHLPIRPKFYIRPSHPPLPPNSERRQLPGLDHLVERVFPNGQQFHDLPGRQEFIDLFLIVIVIPLIAKFIISFIKSHHKISLQFFGVVPYIVVIPSDPILRYSVPVNRILLT